MIRTAVSGVAFLRLDPGEEIVSSIREAAEREGIRGALVIGIGGVSEARVGIFDPGSGRYREVEVRGFHEVASLSGNLSVGGDGSVVPHLHVVLGSEGETVAGHLLEGRVEGTLEVALLELADPLRRVVPSGRGLTLIDA